MPRAEVSSPITAAASGVAADHHLSNTESGCIAERHKDTEDTSGKEVHEGRAETGGMPLLQSQPREDRSDRTAAHELHRPQHGDQFVSTLTEKLLTYALGRGLESDDR